MGSRRIGSFELILLLLSVQLQVHGTDSLVCIKCPAKYLLIRGTCHSGHFGMPVQCKEGEVCSKEVVVYPEVWKHSKGVTAVKLAYRTTKGCVSFKRDNKAFGTLGDCLWIHNESVSPPHSGYRCLCNNTDFCNGTNKWAHGTWWIVLISCLVLKFLHYLMD